VAYQFGRDALMNLALGLWIDGIQETGVCMHIDETGSGMKRIGIDYSFSLSIGEFPDFRNRVSFDSDICDKWIIAEAIKHTRFSY
jgi:hypothetical protein